MREETVGGEDDHRATAPLMQRHYMSCLGLAMAMVVWCFLSFIWPAYYVPLTQITPEGLPGIQPVAAGALFIVVGWWSSWPSVLMAQLWHKGDIWKSLAKASVGCFLVYGSFVFLIVGLAGSDW